MRNNLSLFNLIVAIITTFSITCVCKQQVVSAASFIVSRSASQEWKSSSVIILKAQESSETDAALKFSASYSYTTSPVYVQSHNETFAASMLHEFFSSDEHRNCLLIGSKNMQVSKPEWLKKVHRSLFDSFWDKESTYFQSHGIVRSNQDVSALELLVKTPFLAFIINASALLGVILTKDGENVELFFDSKIHGPEYQFLLFAEDFEADGPPPLLWIFNLLTGRGSKKTLKPELSNKPHPLHAYLRVWVSDSKSFQGEVEADTIVFKASCRAEINIGFPSFLLRVLPVPKEIIERNGNNALLHNMERDIVPGVNKFREVFIKWKQSNNP